MSNKKLKIGQTVYYQSYGTPGGEYLPEARAAIVTEVHDDDPGADEFYVGLCVLNPTGMFFNRKVPFSETPKPGHCYWIPDDNG